jgi:hypothetical protein
MAAASDSEYWTDKLKELERGQLETVANAATAWSALLGALLGTFGIVAFAGGLTSLDKLPAPTSEVVKWMTVAAAVLLALATIAAAVASQKLAPRERPGMSWQKLESESKKRAKTGLNWLLAAKVMGTVLAVIVLVGSALVIIVGEDPSSNPPTVIAIVDGHAVCGELEEQDSVLKVGGVELAGSVTLTVVNKCP